MRHTEGGTDEHADGGPLRRAGTTVAATVIALIALGALGALVSSGQASSSAAQYQYGTLPAVVNGDYPALSGDFTGAGNVVSVSNGTWSGSPTFTYSWWRCGADGGSCAAIPGAISSTYTLQNADLGHYLYALVTATNASGSASWAAFTPWLVGAPQLVNDAYPQWSGDFTAVGNVVSVTTGTWTGTPTITYMWKRCDANAANCDAIAGATTSSYTIQAADLGHRLMVLVTATNANGASTSAPISPVVGAPALIGSDYPQLSGDLTTVGNVISVNSGTWSGSPTITYAWQRCGANLLGCSTIAGATSASYTLQAADLGHFVAAQVTATNANGSVTLTAYSNWAVGTPEVVGSDYPHLSGDLTSAGNVLSVTSGTWTGSPTITYAWQRCDANYSNCVTIDGASSASYTLKNADLGHRINVEVIATNANGSSTATTASQWIVGAPENIGYPQLTGDLTAVGNVLSATSGTWTGSPTIGYTWKRCDAFSCAVIPGATAASYTLQSADLGYHVDVDVTATNAYGSSTLGVPSPWAVGAPELVGSAYPQVTGDTSAVGNVLSASSGTWTGSPTITYAWTRCNASYVCVSAGGASGPTYTLTNADLGYRMRVQVTATNANGSSTVSADSQAVVGTPSSTAPPEISGDTSTFGKVLTVTTGTWSGSPTSFAYQWIRCDVNNCSGVAGATSATYQTTAADLGFRLYANVTATNANGSTTVGSHYSTFIIGAPTNLTFPSISGDASGAGHVLTVDHGTWTGSPSSYAYTWYRCDSAGAVCDPISGETGPTYTTSAADLGHLIRVGVVATNGYGASGEYLTGFAYAIGTPTPTTYPTLSGDTTDVGQVLSITVGAWTGSPTGYSYTWYRCNTAGIACSPIPGATSQTYVIAAADLGYRIYAGVAASNGFGASGEYDTGFAHYLVGGPRPTADDGGITGTPTVGQTLTARHGTWSAAAGTTITFGYRWQRCDPGELNCVEIPGATSATYVVAPADVGHEDLVLISGTNQYGTQLGLVYWTSTIGTSTVAGSVSPASVDYGSVVVGQVSASQTITLTNSGQADLTLTNLAVSVASANQADFQKTGGTCTTTTTLTAGQSCTALVRFTPKATGARSGIFRFVTNAGNIDAALSGSGTTSPAGSVSPASVDYGSVVVGQVSASQTITLTNSGQADLTLTNLAVSVASANQADFQKTGGTCTTTTTLTAGQSCTALVRFTPKATGARSGIFRFVTNAGNIDAALTGTGTSTPAASVSPASVDYGSAVVGSATASQTITLSNSGQADLTLTNLAVSVASANQADFQKTGGTCTTTTTLTAGQSCTALVRFVPKATGARSGIFRFVTNAGNIDAALSGTGTSAPTGSASPASVDYGSVVVGQVSDSQTITLTNTGQADLTLTNLAVSVASANQADFQKTGGTCTTTTTLTAGQSCTALVRFVPKATGARSGIFRFVTNAGNIDAALTGTGA